jgi:capsular polysaccharide biosynthesis protein
MYNVFMELKELIYFLREKALKITIISAVFGIAAVVLYYTLPINYQATGSFYVQRAVETAENNGFFTYEGYYGQQTALTYASTLIGLFESTDIKKQALEEIGVQPTNENLRRFDRHVRVKRTSPQLITLTTKAKTPQEAESLWRAVSSTALLAANTLTSQGDADLRIDPVSMDPLVKEEYRNLYVNILAGLALGLLFAVTSLALINYLKEK